IGVQMGLCLEVQEGDYARALRGYLVETYRPFVDAAQIVAEQIPWRLKEEWRNSTAVEMSAKIQGVAYDKEQVVRLIDTNYSHHPVVLQKAEWLREFVRDQDEEWGKTLLRTVTGSDAISAGTRIYISVTDRDVCVAHTCSRTLDVPTTHTAFGTAEGEEVDDKQKFFNNLTLTLSFASAFDMG
ncbi:MAG: hypothetical protein HYZ48_01170, partial [Chlamydiales bacterium]|nr:hypothetical protein [Chlamydiales bacterium]